LRRKVSALLLSVYAMAVVAATIFPIRPHPASYWAASPWWTMIHYIPLSVDAASFVLNIIMFVPFGLLLPALWPRLDSVRRLAAYAAAASSTIELTQLILGLTVGSRRTVDINDLIANTAGALAGLLVLRVAIPDPRHRALIASHGAGGASAGSSELGHAVGSHGGDTRGSR
jgi:glycopeptide antibiotics resistance protein